MQVAVLIGGVADPKWPLPPDLSLAALQAHAARYATLSPFDEAALELALKLRDADPAVQVVALVAGDDAFCRRVAGWRPDAIHRLELAAVPAWDGAAVAVALAQAVGALASQAAYVFLGREFSDWDDGTVAAALAHALQAPQVPMALSIALSQDGATAVRQGGSGLERVTLPPRALLSVTNDPGNRLRHPLMKNVMLAKKAVIPVWQAPRPAAVTLTCERVEAAVTPPRSSACEWLEGSAREKAQALARVLTDAIEG
jgi:electron transfer flavoprotein beta subunit